jgi:hypothetical protein
MVPFVPADPAVPAAQPVLHEHGSEHPVHEQPTTGLEVRALLATAWTRALHPPAAVLAGWK